MWPRRGAGFPPSTLCRGCLAVVDLPSDAGDATFYTHTIAIALRGPTEKGPPPEPSVELNPGVFCTDECFLQFLESLQVEHALREVQDGG